LILKIRFFLVALFISSLAWSVTPKKGDKTGIVDTQESSADLEFVASAGNYAITKNVYEESLRAAIASGQKDTPELRRAVKEELINRALIAQAAEAEGLADAPEFKDKLAQARQNLLVQAYIEEFFRKEPITEEELRNEYERQRKLLGEGGGATQYQVSQIVVANESEAILLISRLEKGESFSGLARQYSIDASKKDGGMVGWSP
jgi:peptidyl-prolyl cis-trans isomerase C